MVRPTKLEKTIETISSVSSAFFILIQNDSFTEHQPMCFYKFLGIEKYV